MNLDLNSMDKAGLEKLRADIDRALATLESRRRVEARKAAEMAVKEYGYSLDEVLGKEKAAGKAAKGVVRYRNPANPSQTWTGRGRQPAWIKDGLGSGKSLADFAA